MFTNENVHNSRITLGALAGWQFYRTATNLSYLAPVFRGIRQAAHELGCNLLLGCGLGPSASPADPYRPAWPFVSPEHDFVPIGPENTAGLIIAAPLHSLSRSEYVQGLMASGFPVIFIGSGEKGPAIIANNRRGILDALLHLKDHGHHRIAFIAGSLEDMEGDTGDRLRAYQSGCEIFGLAQDHSLVAYGRHVYSGGYLAMQEFLEKGVEFTAVLASNDESALGAMKALEEAGRKIPEDVAIIGFDNRLEGAVNEPGLSSIHVPLFSMGYHAVELLLGSLRGSAKLEQQTYVETRLVVRESCGCNRRENPANEQTAAREAQLLDNEKQDAQLHRTIAIAVTNQAHNLTEERCLECSQNLAASFGKGIQTGDSEFFDQALIEILQSTAANGDDPYIWHAALSLLENWSEAKYSANPTLASNGKKMISDGRLAISHEVQRQHSRYVADERWNTSRLSLLTARLLTALDENQIYEILSNYLPSMNIKTAVLALLDGEEEDPAAWCTLRNILAKERPLLRIRSFEFPPQGFFDSVTPYQLTLIPVVDPSGQVGFMVFDSEHLDLYGAIVQQLGGALNTARLYRQATEGRRMAEEANRMKSRFLSTISHELRTPLNLIVGVSGILLNESDEEKSLLPEGVQKDIGRIHAYAQHLGGLIGDVLDLATTAAGQLRLNMELIDLAETLRLAAESGSQLTADKGLTWKTAIPEKGPWVWADRTRLRQVVLNLLNNAVKFTTYGSVSLTVETNGKTVTVRVCDTGIGIPPEEQEAIFNEFRRSERSIGLGYPGLGLGLSICKTLIEIHDGKIGLESTGVEGEGSCFYFSLPTAEPPPEPQAGVLSAPTLKQSVLLLVTRKNTSDRLHDLLVTQGIRVQTELMDRDPGWLSIMAESPPDAIILDVSIQSELGWRALRRIKNSHLGRGIPIMFYSSSPNGEGVLNMDYLTKPIELSDLTQSFDHVRLMFDADQPVQTVLVVDDEPHTLEMHARIVQSQSSSFHVYKAQDGHQALKILHQEKVDVVLLDLQMPGLDGFGVLEAMRTNDRLRNIPVIVVTGKILTEDDMARLDQGVATVLNKGVFSSDEIVTHISQSLKRKRKLSQDAQRLVRQAMAYIHENYLEQISRREIAQQVNISEDYLTFCFRQELGITPIKYLQRFRVTQAKLLLKASQKSITEIAFDVGFSDSGYFSRIFHRETGYSPEDFRLYR